MAILFIPRLVQKDLICYYACEMAISLKLKFLVIAKIQLFGGTGAYEQRGTQTQSMSK